MNSETQNHRISLAVWDVPPTVVAGERFTIKAGAKSSADCHLGGRCIEACDAAGAVIASGKLSATPWPGTTALAWAELSLPAPTQHGMASLTARCAAADLDPPHGETSFRFDVVVVPSPEHTVTLQVVVKETAAPLDAAEVRLGPYCATTDVSGQATIRLAKGQYDLCIWKVGFEAPPRRITINGEVEIVVEAVILPEENADRAWRA